MESNGIPLYLNYSSVRAEGEWPVRMWEGLVVAVGGACENMSRCLTLIICLLYSHSRISSAFF